MVLLRRRVLRLSSEHFHLYANPATEIETPQSLV